MTQSSCPGLSSMREEEGNANKTSKMGNTFWPSIIESIRAVENAITSMLATVFSHLWLKLMDPLAFSFSAFSLLCYLFTSKSEGCGGKGWRLHVILREEHCLTTSQGDAERNDYILLFIYVKYVSWLNHRRIGSMLINIAKNFRETRRGYQTEIGKISEKKLRRRENISIGCVKQWLKRYPLWLQAIPWMREILAWPLLAIDLLKWPGRLMRLALSKNSVVGRHTRYRGWRADALCGYLASHGISLLPSSEDSAGLTVRYSPHTAIPRHLSTRLLPVRLLSNTRLIWLPAWRYNRRHPHLFTYLCAGYLCISSYSWPKLSETQPHLLYSQPSLQPELRAAEVQCKH